MEFKQLKEQFNKGFENLLPVTAGILNQLFGREFQVEVKLSDETNLQELAEQEKFPRVHLQFLTVGQNNFQHLISFAPDFSQKLLTWMVGGEPKESLGEEILEGLQEGVNQVFDQLMASQDGEEGAFTVENLMLTVAESFNAENTNLPENSGLAADYSIVTGEETSAVQHFVWPANAVEGQSEKTAETQVSADPDPVEEQTNAVWDEAADKPFAGVTKEDAVDVHPAQFEDFQSEAGGNGHPRNMNMLLDVKLEVVVELGRKTMLIRDVLKLGKGAVVELEKAAGEPLEIFVSERKLAEGEVVVVDDHFGIRITQLIGPKERVKSLG